MLTRFGQSLHFRGMTTGAPPQYCNTGCSGVSSSCRLPPTSMSLCRHGYNSNPPIIFMRRSGSQSLTRTLPYNAKYNSSPNVTGLVQIFAIYSTLSFNGTSSQKERKRAGAAALFDRHRPGLFIQSCLACKHALVFGQLLRSSAESSS